MKYFMGVDVGTSESKGALTDENARVVAYAARPHDMETPRPGWAEHDADGVWWADFCAISRELIANSGVAPRDIAAVAASAIAPCCLPLDERGRPLRKAILYGVDVRAAREIEYLESLYGREAILKKYGTPISSQSAAAKILWLKNNEPEVYAKAAGFVTASTYLTEKLCGRRVIDRYTAASWPPLYDPEREDWEADTSLFCERDKLPECLWTDEIAGRVTDEAARETGLMAGTPVMCGTADAASEAVSAGVLSPGDLMLMYGSSLFMIHVSTSFAHDARVNSGPYLFPGTYAVTAGMSCAGTATKWFRDNFARDIVREAKERGENPYALLAREAESASAEGLTVLPYFSGERTPINDPLAKAVIFGLDLTHTRADVFRALLEGIGYGVGQHTAIFDELGLGTRRVMAVGGGVNNRAWLQIVSDICSVTQRTVEVRLGACYGDALLAALGAGLYSSPGDMARAVREDGLIEPDASKRDKYSSGAKRYAALYRATRPLI